MIPRAARAARAAAPSGVLVVVPRSRRPIDHSQVRPPFGVRIPAEGLTLSAAWSACAAYAAMIDDRSAARAAFLALADAHEAAGLTAVDEWRPGSGRPLHELDILGRVATGYMGVPDFAAGEGLDLALGASLVVELS